MLAQAGALIVNPNAALKMVRDGASIHAITVHAPVKGQPLKVTTIERTAEPALFAALLVHSATQGMSADKFNAAERTRLSDIGLLVSEDRVSTPVWFSCDLTDPPDDLIPLWAARRTRVRADDVANLVANPTLRQLGGEGPTPDMRGRLKLPNRFRTDRSWLMIQEPDACAPGLYSFSPESDEEVGVLVPGQPPPDTLRPNVRQQLLDASVIQSAEEPERRRAARPSELAAAGGTLRENRYVVLPQIFAPLQLAAVRRYYRAQIAEGFLTFGDADWPDRYFSGRDPICYFFHHQLTDAVSAVAGERVKPSFAFFASYHPGSVLPPHRDRDQCEYSMSILIDHSPELDQASPWPLYLHPPGAPAAVPISTRLGDAVLYKGREVTHYREPLAAADYCSFWFFFYVPESFDGPLD
jgi:hypothetical protein